MNVLLKTKELHSSIVRKLFSDKCDTKITPVQGQIIKYLATNENVYQKDIENLLKLRRSTISGILHTMEKNDLIKKSSDEKDFRTKRITLTKKSLELYNYIDLNFKKLNDEICRNIDKTELSIFMKVIDQMIDNIK